MPWFEALAIALGAWIVVALAVALAICQVFRASSLRLGRDCFEMVDTD